MQSAMQANYKHTLRYCKSISFRHHSHVTQGPKEQESVAPVARQGSLPKHPALTVRIKECKQKPRRRYGILSHAASMPYATKFRKNNDEPETLQMNCKAALN